MDPWRLSHLVVEQLPWFCRRFGVLVPSSMAPFCLLTFCTNEKSWKASWKLCMPCGCMIFFYISYSCWPVTEYLVPWNIMSPRHNIPSFLEYFVLGGHNIPGSPWNIVSPTEIFCPPVTSSKATGKYSTNGVYVGLILKIITIIIFCPL